MISIREYEYGDDSEVKKIFESGQCPYCDSKLKSHDHSKILTDLKEKDKTFPTNF